MLAIDCSTHDVVCCKCGDEWNGTVCRPEDNDGVTCGFADDAVCECFERFEDTDDLPDAS